MDPVTLALARAYADQLALGGGSLKGAPATVQSIVPISGGNEVTFGWTLADGSTQTSTMTVKDGINGIDGKDGESVTLNMPAVTLQANSWTDKKQTISVTGALADESKQAIIPMPVDMSRDAYHAAKITTYVPTDGQIEFTAETVPTENIFLYVALFGVNPATGGGESTIAWYPSVDPDGNLSWSRISTSTAPPDSNIRGPQGDTGPEGPQGVQGLQGVQGIQGEQGERGEQGVQGIPGISPTLTESADNAADVYKLDITDINGTFTTPNLVGRQGAQGIQGERGETGPEGPQGVQGIQGIKGDKGEDGYPFLIYKEYASVDEFNAGDFPEIGLMFMVNDGVSADKPVYRYTGEAGTPYSHVTDMSTSEGLKGEKGDKGDQGEQGTPGPAGADGADGKTYTPRIGTVQGVDAMQDAAATVDVDEGNSLATYNFWLPRGPVGQQGLKGDTGEKGDTGDPGTTYTPAIGTIETVDSALDATASVEIDPDTKQAKFNFSLPRGEKGADGLDAPQILDTEIRDDRTWSSEKIDTAKLSRFSQTFVGMTGQAANATISVGEFLGALSSKYGNAAYIYSIWSNDSRGYVTDGNLTVEINGGILLFSATGSAATPFPNSAWQYAEAVYYPVATADVVNKTYKFVGRVSGTAGTPDFEKIYEFSGQTTADVASTTITYDTATAVTTSGGEASTYYIRNGVCYVSLDFTAQTTTDATVKLADAPKPAQTINAPAVIFDGSGAGAVVKIYSTGLRVAKITSGKRYICSFSYPVST